jgi:hypothetical protein
VFTVNRTEEEWAREGAGTVEEVGSGEVVESILVFCSEETEELITECVINR